MHLSKTLLTCVVAGLLGATLGWWSNKIRNGSGSVQINALQAAADAIPRISAYDLHQALTRADITVVDVRSEQQFCAQHIPGAVSIPVDRLTLQAFPAGKRLVTYCSCPHDHAAASGAVLLRKNGTTDVQVLSGGITAWCTAGFSVEGGAGSKAPPMFP